MNRYIQAHSVDWFYVRRHKAARRWLKGVCAVRFAGSDRFAESATPGKNGSRGLVRVVTVLLRHFRLDDEDALFALLQVYNRRCSPQWDSDELWQAIADVRKRMNAEASASCYTAALASEREAPRKDGADSMSS